MVVIEPDFSYVKNIKKTRKKYSKTRKLEDGFSKLVQTTAKKCGIQATLVDANKLSESGTDYFNYLLPLKKDILNANFMQETLSHSESGNAFREYTQTFDKSPVLPAKYSHLSTKYGTPYFCIQGVITVITPNKVKPLQILFPPSLINAIINPKEESFYYNIVADVNSGEVVYREIRVFDRFPNKGDLGMMVYDSFKILNRKK